MAIKLVADPSISGTAAKVAAFGAALWAAHGLAGGTYVLAAGILRDPAFWDLQYLGHILIPLFNSLAGQHLSVPMSGAHL